ncbi:hypothetical protein A3Q56_06440, partial [Intoshia linei]
MRLLIFLILLLWIVKCDLPACQLREDGKILICDFEIIKVDKDDEGQNFYYQIFRRVNSTLQVVYCDFYLNQTTYDENNNFVHYVLQSKVESNNMLNFYYFDTSTDRIQIMFNYNFIRLSIKDPISSDSGYYGIRLCKFTDKVYQKCKSRASQFISFADKTTTNIELGYVTTLFNKEYENGPMVYYGQPLHITVSIEVEGLTKVEYRLYYEDFAKSYLENGTEEEFSNTIDLLVNSNITDYYHVDGDLLNGGRLFRKIIITINANFNYAIDKPIICSITHYCQDEVDNNCTIAKTLIFNT